jgi:transcriptional regulator with XRE-family HTH domain
LAHRKPDPTLPKIGARLALTRRALDLTRFQMARLLGTDTSTWGTYEAGLQRIPADQALKLSAYGIPLDWVYDGKVANLHPHIREKIRQLAS